MKRSLASLAILGLTVASVASGQDTRAKTTLKVQSKAPVVATSAGASSTATTASASWPGKTSRAPCAR